MMLHYILMLLFLFLNTATTDTDHIYNIIKKKYLYQEGSPPLLYEVSKDRNMKDKNIQSF